MDFIENAEEETLLSAERKRLLSLTREMIELSVKENQVDGELKLDASEIYGLSVLRTTKVAGLSIPVETQAI